MHTTGSLAAQSTPRLTTATGNFLMFVDSGGTAVVRSGPNVVNGLITSGQATFASSIRQRAADQRDVQPGAAERDDRQDACSRLLSRATSSAGVNATVAGASIRLPLNCAVHDPATGMPRNA